MKRLVDATANTQLERGTRDENDRHSAALSAALSTLDRLLGVAVDRLARVIGPASLLDPWRGMHLTVDDVRMVLARDAHLALTNRDLAQALVDQLMESPRILRMLALVSLDAFELATLLLVLAPDLDLRYERIYAYLQDDMTRKRPGMDLLANLLCTSAEERLVYLRCTERGASLSRHRMLSVRAVREVGALARPCEIDAPWLAYLTGRPTNELLGDPRVRVIEPVHRLDETAVEPTLRDLLDSAIESSRSAVCGLRLHLHGSHGTGKFALAQGVAAECGRRLHTVDVGRCESAEDTVALIERAHINARLDDAVLYVHGCDRLRSRDAGGMRALVEALGAVEVPLIVSSVSGTTGAHAFALSALRIRLSPPSAKTRELAWGRALGRHGLSVRAADVKRVAMRYRLDVTQIDQAAADLGMREHLLGARPLNERSLSEEARSLCGDELAALAHRIEPQAGFDALVANPEVLAQLHEIRDRLLSRHLVAQWTRGSVHTRHTGITALFAGPSGTGKTLAAEVIAREVGFDLFRIDLAGIVSKYIGETEKNLDRVFAAAVNANAVLFFDEADALFGKRSEVKDAHDRYANVEIAYLLQKMEQFDGLAILATNLKQNLDEAFTRRLAFCVNFAFPEEPERVRLWNTLWPRHAPCEADIELGWFAREYRLSGGNIRNVVLAAAHLAAANGGTITRDHVLHATRREFQKVGKTLGPSVSLGAHAA